MSRGVMSLGKAEHIAMYMGLILITEYKEIRSDGKADEKLVGYFIAFEVLNCDPGNAYFVLEAVREDMQSIVGTLHIPYFKIDWEEDSSFLYRNQSDFADVIATLDTMPTTSGVSRFLIKYQDQAATPKSILLGAFITPGWFALLRSTSANASIRKSIKRESSGIDNISAITSSSEPLKDLSDYFGMIVILECRLDGTEASSGIPFEVIGLSEDNSMFLARAVYTDLRQVVGIVNIPVFTVNLRKSFGILDRSQWMSINKKKISYLNPNNMQISDTLWYAISQPEAVDSIVMNKSATEEDSSQGGVIVSYDMAVKEEQVESTDTEDEVEVYLSELIIAECVAEAARAETLLLLLTALQTVCTKEGIIDSYKEDINIDQQVSIFAKHLIQHIIEVSLNKYVIGNEDSQIKEIINFAVAIERPDTIEEYEIPEAVEKEISRQYTWTEYLQILADESKRDVSEMSSIGDLCRKNNRLYRLIELGCDLASTAVDRLAQFDVTPKVTPIYLEEVEPLHDSLKNKARRKPIHKTDGPRMTRRKRLA